MQERRRRPRIPERRPFLVGNRYVFDLWLDVFDDNARTAVWGRGLDSISRASRGEGDFRLDSIIHEQ